MIKIVKDAGVNLSIVSNGTLINDEHARKIVELKVDNLTISIDGLKDTHNSFRTYALNDHKINAFGLSTNALERLEQEKSRQKSDYPKLQISTLVSKANHKEIPELIDYLNKKFNLDEIALMYFFDITNADVTTSEAQLLDEEKAGNTTWFSTSTSNLSLDKAEIEELLKKVKHTNNIYIDPYMRKFTGRGRQLWRTCIWTYISVWISPEGNVFPCPMLENYNIGNIKEQNILELYNNKKYKNFRRNIHKKRPSICRKCCMMKNAPRDFLEDLKKL